MNRPFNWAFIGTGTLAKTVAREITRSGRHRVVSVYSRNPEKRGAFAKKYGALPAGSPEEAMTAPGVDGVYIVTPHTSHKDYALMALDLGKPVLCEKPVTTDRAKAEEMIRKSREKGIYFAEAMWTWFSPVANQVKAWLDAGEYGEIESAFFNYHLRSMGYAPRVADPNLAGGALLDIGIYGLTYAYRLFGKPEKIRCLGDLQGGVDTGERISLYYPGGRIFTVDSSIVNMKGLERMVLQGTEGSTSLWFFHGAGKVKLKRKGGKSMVFKGDGSYLNEFDIVSSEIREGLTESRCVPHQATLDVMEMMDECRRQLHLVYPFEKEKEEEKDQEK